MVGVTAWQRKRTCTQKIVRGSSMARESSPLMSSKSAVIPECAVSSSTVPWTFYCTWAIHATSLYVRNFILPVIYPILLLVFRHTYVTEIPMGCWKLCFFNFFCRCYLSFLQTFGAKTLLVILRQMLPFTWVATMYVIFKESTLFPNFLLKS